MLFRSGEIAAGKVNINAVDAAGIEAELRQVDPRTGEVLEALEMPPGVSVSGLESDGGNQFFCGGGKSRKVRTVRRPRRGSAQK